MSDAHSHRGSSGTRKPRLFAFRVVPADLLTQYGSLIREVLFGGAAAPSGKTVFEIDPVSGYLNYRNPKKLYREERRRTLALPRTKEEATRAAMAFLAGRYEAFTGNAHLRELFANSLNEGKSLALPFSAIPHPGWLKHFGTSLVRNDKHPQPDHWLCKFQVEVECPDKSRLPVLNSSIDVRIGEAAADARGVPNYEVVGFQSRWRPVYDAYPVERFLPDSGAAPPAHAGGHAEAHSEASAAHLHAGKLTRLAYLLADENVPQFNLLPYEATVSGEHHLSILPASKDSLWVEFNVRRVGGKYRIQALVMGGSGDYQAHWGFWDPFQYEIGGDGRDADYREAV